MYRGLKLNPPFFEIGPKAYLYGQDSLNLALQADRLSQTYRVQVIYTPQTVDIAAIARETRNVWVFAQHMDSLEIGRGVGSVLPEAVKAAGAVGVLLNHAEKPLTPEEIRRTIRRADEVGLLSMVCAGSPEEVEQVARMEPNIVLAESPQLIGTGRRSADDREAIASINQIVWEINPEILVLHGAGISCGQDVYEIIAAGAQATGSTSGILKAQDPYAMLAEMIRAVREAWDKTHSSI
jgi:triosephosphate isomerase (TIM)